MKILFLLLNTILVAAELSLPVVESANYLIKFNRNAGIYELYYRERASNRLINLLGAPSPHTDYLSISLDGELYTLGRDERYLAPLQQRLQLLSNGGAIKWLLPYQVDVTQYLRIIDQQPLVSYVRMDIVVDNRSNINRSIGLFQIYDLSKINSGAPAFSIPEGEVYRESFYQGSSIPSYVRTSYDFYLYFDIRGTTRPQRITLAQWRKIHDAGWNYAFSLNKQGFGYNLYDTNAPALGAYYDPRPLLSGQSRIYTTYLSRQLLVEPKEATADQPIPQPFKPPLTPEPPLNEDTSAQQKQHNTAPTHQPPQRNDLILQKLTSLEEQLAAWQQQLTKKKEVIVEPAPKTGETEKQEVSKKQEDLSREKELYLNQKKRFLLLEKLQQQLLERLENEKQQLFQLAARYRLHDYKPSLSDIQLLIDQARAELSIWDSNYLRLMSIPKKENSELAKLHTLLTSTRSSLDQDYLSWQSLYNLLNVIDMQQFNALSLEHILEQFEATLNSSREKYQILADLQRYNYGVAERLTEARLSRFYSDFARLISTQRHYLSTGVELLEQWDNFLRGEVKSWLHYQAQSKQLQQLFAEFTTSLEYHRKGAEATKNDLYLASQLFTTLDAWNENDLASEQKSPTIDISIQKKELLSIIQRLERDLANSTTQIEQLSTQLDMISEQMSLSLQYFALHKQSSVLLTQWQPAEKQLPSNKLRLNDKMADTYKQPLYPLNEDKLYSSLEEDRAKHLVEKQPRIDAQEEYEPDSRQNITTTGVPIFNIQPHTPHSTLQHSILDSQGHQQSEEQPAESQDNRMTQATTSNTPKRLTPSNPQALTGQPKITERKSIPNNGTIIQDKLSLKNAENKEYNPQIAKPQTSDPLTHSPLSQETDNAFSLATSPQKPVVPQKNNSLPNAAIDTRSTTVPADTSTNPLGNKSFLNEETHSLETSPPQPASQSLAPHSSAIQAQTGSMEKKSNQNLEETSPSVDLLLEELLQNSEQVLSHPYSFDPRKVARIRQIWQQLQAEEP